MTENNLILNKHTLIIINEQLENYDTTTIDYVTNNFAGIIINNLDITYQENLLIYLTGNINVNLEKLQIFNNIFIIKELSYNFDKNDYCISIDNIPLNIHNVGIFFKQYFDINKNYFDLISEAHQFQLLKESDKPTNAYRTGIYITKVEELNDEIKFKLLRCSTNLNGSTDNFRDVDNEIINNVNKTAEYFFEEKTDLNHVLAQIYGNTKKNNKNKKAKIKAHSDKTKDMLKNGVMAFCSFYHNHIETVNCDNIYEYCCNHPILLTKIKFRLKNSVIDEKYKKMFDIILYPNSLLLIPLSTNRIYTHEIIPSGMPIENIPIRMGYVIRCSKTNSIYKNNKTYIYDNNNNLIELEKPTIENIDNLKNLYYAENMTTDIIDYGIVNFSLNEGDYEKPIV